MANRILFRRMRGRLTPGADTVNEAGGRAYQLSPAAELAQYVMTGCLNQTYYATAENQLDRVLELSSQVDPEFVAKLAVCARRNGGMKDMPALLCAVLSVRDTMFFEKAARASLDSARMVRNFVQILRSGVVGRKSLGTAPKRFVQEWLYHQSDEALFRGAVGNEPSLADIIRMVHPRPATEAREALYAYLIGREYDAGQLPALVREYERFKADRSGLLPDVPFQYLAALDLSDAQWAEIARKAPWQMTRMNLNTFARHGVFSQPGMVEMIAERLRDPMKVRRARVLPYQLMVAYLQAGDGVPLVIREALQDALEIATENIPEFRGKVVVCPDVSSSMHSPVTGHRAGSASKVRCVDVAALVAASILRRNQWARIIPFTDRISTLKINPCDSVMTNATRMAKLPPGGTNCSLPLNQLVRENASVDLVVFISDNESWMDTGYGRGTATMEAWEALRQRNPQARLVCLDIQPYGTSQARSRSDILNIGGFSDQVFTVVRDFARGTLNGEHWIERIGQLQLD